MKNATDEIEKKSHTVSTIRLQCFAMPELYNIQRLHHTLSRSEMRLGKEAQRFACLFVSNVVLLLSR
jgi:hypothetical protein